jgi:putative endopeptidase
MEKVRIQDDLYLYVNQETIDNLVIPDDRPSTGGFATLNSEVEELMMKEFSDMCENNSFENDYLKRACALYKATKNVEKKESDGIAPALKYLSVFDISKI